MEGLELKNTVIEMKNSPGGTQSGMTRQKEAVLMKDINIHAREALKLKETPENHTQTGGN